ncbi:MAG: DUF2958 domain-containing protein, partial [Planctomycetes bacterium]|nr:DUF2958 domain-containing protein [Planctomycetota bacterium]
MKLLTEEIRKKLPPLYSQDGKGGKVVASIKFFTPDSGFTWWITEGSPIKDESGNEVDFHFFGLVEGQFKELGYVSLKELEEVRGPMGLPIEREVLNRWRTLDLPIMPPGPVSFHAFLHKLPGLHSPVKHACVYDYKTP